MSEGDALRANVSAPEALASTDVAPEELTVDVRSGREPILDLRDGDSRSIQLTRRRMFGLDFVDAPSLEPVIDALLDRQPPAHPGQTSTVLTPNVDIMVQLDEDRSRTGPVWDMFRSSQFCLPDGQPIVMASQLLRRPLRARLTGSGLFAELWPRLVADKRQVYVVASSEEVANLLRAEYSAAKISVAPMFSADDDAAIDKIAMGIVGSSDDVGNAPEFVFLSLGNPKDALIADAVLKQWPAEKGIAPTLLGLGGSASMHVGITKRAPDWVQRIGMEWFYRFVQEPRRLFHRYFVRDVAFLGLVWREFRLHGRGGDVPVEGSGER